MAEKHSEKKKQRLVKVDETLNHMLYIPLVGYIKNNLIQCLMSACFNFEQWVTVCRVFFVS